MGEADYYMKADNCSEEKLEKIREFFHEGARAEDWWQNHRGYEHRGERDLFWSEFEVKFPLVTEYAKFIKLFGRDCNNDPAGKLDFGSHDAIDNQMELNDSTLYYFANVWHFADWDGLMKFLKKKFELGKCRWLSDEYTNPFDLL